MRDSWVEGRPCGYSRYSKGVACAWNTQPQRGTPKQVTILGKGDIKYVDFEHFSKLICGDIIPTPVKTDSAENAFREALYSNYENSFKQILQKTIKGTGCAQLLNIVQNKENVSEPLWRAGLSIAKFCKDSKKAIDVISIGHEGYDKQLTQEKVDLIKGPYRCERF